MPGKETAPERAISYGGDTKLAAGLKKTYFGILDISTAWAVFHLDGGDRVDFVGTAKGGRGNLAKTEVLNFSFPGGRVRYSHRWLSFAPLPLEDFYCRSECTYN